MEGGDEVGGSDAEHFSGMAEGVLGAAVAVAGGDGGGFGIGLAGGAGDGGAGGDGLDAAGVAAAADGTIGEDGLVADFPGSREAAEAEAAVDDDAAADSGAESK